MHLVRVFIARHDDLGYGFLPADGDEPVPFDQP